MSMEDVSISPLKLALESAQAKLQEAIVARIELEAKAQEADQARGNCYAGGPGYRHDDRVDTVPAQVAIDAKNTLASLDEGTELQAQTLTLQLAEEKAAAAMKECELAVKEEMQAKEVVKVGLHGSRQWERRRVTAWIGEPDLFMLGKQSRMEP